MRYLNLGFWHIVVLFNQLIRDVQMTLLDFLKLYHEFIDVVNRDVNLYDCICIILIKMRSKVIKDVKLLKPIKRLKHTRRIEMVDTAC